MVRNSLMDNPNGRISRHNLKSNYKKYVKESIGNSVKNIEEGIGKI